MDSIAEVHECHTKQSPIRRRPLGRRLEQIRSKGPALAGITGAILASTDDDAVTTACVDVYR